MTDQAQRVFGSPEWQAQMAGAMQEAGARLIGDPEKVWAAFAEAGRSLLPSQEALDTFVAEVGGVMQKCLAAYTAFGAQLVEACWAEYRAAGMPYGESFDAMMLWLDHRSAAARAEEEAEDRRTTEIALAKVRAKVRARDDDDG